MFFSCIINGLNNILSKNKVVIAFIEFIIITISFIEIVYYIMFGISVNADTIFLLLQTNFNESMSFIKANTLTIIFIIFALIIAAIVLYKLNKSEKGYSKNKKIWVSVLIFIFTLFLDNKFVFSDEHLYLHRDFNIAYGYFKQLELMSQKEELGEAITAAANPKKIVIVLGESANRDYMQAFGYERENTPWLSSMKVEYHPIFYCMTKLIHHID